MRAFNFVIFICVFLYAGSFSNAFAHPPCQDSCVFGVVDPNSKDLVRVQVTQTAHTKSSRVKKAYVKQGMKSRYLKDLMDDFKRSKKITFEGLVDSEGNRLLDDIYDEVVPLSPTHSMVLTHRGNADLPSPRGGLMKWYIAEHGSHKLSSLPDKTSLSVQTVFLENQKLNVPMIWLGEMSYQSAYLQHLRPDLTLGPRVENVNAKINEAYGMRNRGLGSSGDYLLVYTLDRTTNQESQTAFNIYGESTDQLDDLVQINVQYGVNVPNRISMGIAGPVPSDLNANVDYMYWPYLNGELLPQSPDVAGMVPAIVASDNKGINSQFKTWITVFNADDGYDYALTVLPNSSDPLEILQYIDRFERFDDVRIFDDQTGLYFRRLPTSPTGNSWHVIPQFTYFFENSMDRVAILNNGYDYERAVQGGLTIAEADAKLAAHRKAQRESLLAERAEERERKRLLREQEAAARAAKVVEVERLLSEFETRSWGSKNCDMLFSTLTRINYGGRDASILWKAIQIDQVEACQRVPINLIELYRNAPPPQQFVDQRNIWERFNDQLDQVPTVLKCTKDYSTKTETCQWVK